MIQCSHCGTQNRDGSKFCSDCGARLVQQSGLVCPMCGEANTVENVFCRKCGARLVPLTVAPAAERTPPPTPIKGLSLPAKPAEPPAPAAKAEPKPVEPPAPAAKPEPKPVEPPAPVAPIEIPKPAPAEEIKSGDWLARLRASSPEEDAPISAPSSETTAPTSEESGDWLAQLRATQTEEPAAPPAISPQGIPPRPPAEAFQVDEEDLPDWLRSSSAPAAQEPAPAPAEEPLAWTPPPAKAELTSPAATDETPSWMSQLRAEAEQAAVAPTAGSDDDIPDWLRDTGVSPALEQATPSVEEPGWVRSVPAEFQAPPPVPATEAEIPDWLKTLKPKTEEPAAPITPFETIAPVEAAAPSEVVTPSPIVLPVQAAAPIEIAAPSAEIRGGAVTPGEELLESLEAATAVPLPPSVEEPAWLTETPRQVGEEEDVPDWLRTPAAGAVPAAAAGEAAAEPSQVPDWIAALKPAEPAAPGIFDRGPVEASGPLAGLRGVLPLASAIAEPHAPPKSAPPSPFKETASIFESILAAPVLAPAVPVAKPARRQLTMRPFIYALMLLAVLLPFFVPDISNASVRTFGARAAEFYDLVQAIQPNSIVVLAFDYDPGSAGEMDLQANVLVRHLMKKGARIVAISTLDPTGAQIAQRVLDDAARATGNYTYGTNYLNLGFIAGQEAGLNQLAVTGFVPATTSDYVKRQTLDKYPNFLNIQNWRNVALLIELAGAPEPLQKWMEQVQPRAGVKIAAGVSAAVEPRAVAYRNSNQVVATLSGVMGAAQYEALSNQRGLALISAGAQSTAQLVLIGLIIAGNIVYWFSRGRGEAK
ncbi:MAG: zinc-ribbon domain-containing protein [Chloroflexota bacterium]